MTGATRMLPCDTSVVRMKLTKPRRGSAVMMPLSQLFGMCRSACLYRPGGGSGSDSCWAKCFDER